MRPPGRGFAVVDVETTGLDPRQDRVVQVAITLLDPGGQQQSTWSSLVNPQRDPGPVHVHGLTSQDLACAPQYAQVADQISQALQGRLLVAHNVDFDWAFLHHEHRRAGCRLPVTHRMCTMDLARALRLPVRNLRLAALADHFGVAQVRAHDAVDDTRVLVEILQASLDLAGSNHVKLPVLPCSGLAGRWVQLWRSPARFRMRRQWRRARRLMKRRFCRNPLHTEKTG